jgi:hypothetical protein
VIGRAIETDCGTGRGLPEAVYKVRPRHALELAGITFEFERQATRPVADRPVQLRRRFRLLQDGLRQCVI